MQKHPKILIMAATGAYNLGDECILLREVAYLRELYPDGEICIATYDPTGSLVPHDKNISYIQYFPSGLRAHPWDNIGYLWDNIVSIARADILVIGGGGIFFSTLGEHAFRLQVWQWLFRVFVARISRTRVFFWSISIEVPQESLHPVLSRLFSLAHVTVSVRDRASQLILKNLGIDAKIIPDAAIGYNIGSDVLSPSKVHVGIALRHGYLREQQESIIRIVEFVRNRGYEPVFLSFSLHPSLHEENDYAMFRSTAETLNVSITTTITETLSRIADMEVMIAMRLHAAILASSSGIPTLVLSYGSKTREFAQSLSLPCIDAHDFSLSLLETEFDILLTQRRSLRTELILRTQSIAEQGKRSLHTSLLEIDRAGV